jgi:manganese/zinc/iron transport system substrate-binding protein
MLSMASLASCGGPSEPAANAGAGARPSSGLPTLVATTPMVADVVRNVVGPHAEVITLIGPGVDPHLWTPTRTDVLQILDADAVFINGLMLEGRIGDSIARVETMKRPVLRIAQTVDRKELLTDPRRASYFDPHIWMDPVIWGRTALPVAELLAGVIPKHADEFRENARRYAEAADALAEECARALRTIPRTNRTLISAHDAFEYYGRRFELDVRGIQGLSTESEASIADIEQLVAEIVERRVPTAFVETTVSDRTVRALVEGCASIGHELRIGEALYSDSLGRPGTPEGTWLGMIRHNTRVIVGSLGGNP